MKRELTVEEIDERKDKKGDWEHRTGDRFNDIMKEYEKLAILHGLCEEYYSRKDSILFLICVIFSTIVSVISVYDTTTPDKKDYISFIIMFFSIFSTISTSIQKYKKFSELSQNHANIRHLSLGISQTIKIQLALHKPDRVSPMNLFSIIELSMDNIVKTAPMIPVDVYEMYKTRYINSRVIISEAVEIRRDTSLTP